MDVAVKVLLAISNAAKREVWFACASTWYRLTNISDRNTESCEA